MYNKYLLLKYPLLLLLPVLRDPQLPPHALNFIHEHPLPGDRAIDQLLNLIEPLKLMLDILVLLARGLQGALEVVLLFFAFEVARFQVAVDFVLDFAGRVFGRGGLRVGGNGGVVLRHLP
jgi:hypothetical protein